MSVGTMTSKGQITVPREIREALGLEPGDRLRFELDGEDVRVSRERDLVELAGSVSVPDQLRGRDWSAVEAEAHADAARQAESRGRPDAD